MSMAETVRMRQQHSHAPFALVTISGPSTAAISIAISMWVAHHAAFILQVC